ncbi:XdhC family protein [Dehalococcoidia bacterium]|nr:XdhC family protein [Dehalococcoidia bacterium]
MVKTKGSTPQKPGAKLLVRRDGTAVGTLGGGCVEADVWAEAKIILEENRGVQVRHFLLNEDIAAKDGLVCGGSMDILIDPVDDKPEMAMLVGEIVAAYEGKGDRAMATLVADDQDELEGAKIFIRADGTSVGTLGSKILDRKAISVAIELMPRGRDLMVDGRGRKKFYVESFTTPPTLVIAGGGHVGKALYTAATFAGFRTVIVDDRPMYANKERFPEAAQVVVDDFAQGLRDLDMGPNYYVVIATRGHKLDDIALKEAAKSRAGYVGLLGSKRKAMLIYRDLLRQGVPEDRIAEIKAPVGLDLGGRTPEEIALSIVSEMLATRYGRVGAPLAIDSEMVSKAKELAEKPPSKRTVEARL